MVALTPMRYLILTFCLLSASFLFGQEIPIQNPSFEGSPQDATMPGGWDGCGILTTPDILPGPWGVYTETQHGDTYIGIIVRDNDTWEWMSQRLSEPLKQNECYAFSAHLARSPSYSGYNKAVKLKIWAGSSRCKKEELLAETEPVEHIRWERYDFTFFPKKDYRYLILEAYYVDGAKVPYKGNILIDGLSTIKNCKRVSTEGKSVRQF